MTEKEFLRKAERLYGRPTGDANSWMTPSQALSLAKEAGAVFEPEREQIWYAKSASGHEVRLMVPGRRNSAEELGPFLWEYKTAAGEWEWAGSSIYHEELGRRILAEREGSGSGGPGWAKKAALDALLMESEESTSGHLIEATKEGVKVIAEAIARHAPAVEDVVEALQDPEAPCYVRS